MTLRTLAQIAFVLGHRVEIALKPLSAPPGEKNADLQLIDQPNPHTKEAASAAPDQRKEHS